MQWGHRKETTMIDVRAMELTKTFLSSSIHDVTNNLTGGLKWTL